MELEDKCSIAAYKACGVKVSMCRIQGGPYDLAGMVHFFLRGGDEGTLLLGEGHVSDTIPKAWAKILQQGIPAFVIVLAESYTDKTLHPTNHRVVGQLLNDFNTNPCSQVRENICIYGIDTTTGRQIAVRIPFGYDDQGMPTFEKPEKYDTTGDGLTSGVIPIPHILAGCSKGIREL